MPAYTYYVGSSRRTRKKGAERLFEEIIAKNNPKSEISSRSSISSK